VRANVPSCTLSPFLYPSNIHSRVPSVRAPRNTRGTRGCVPANTSVRLIDFGTAEFCARDKFRHALVGTRQYRAPEVVFGSGWNHTLDIWAVGCVVAEMLCGRQLFPAVRCALRRLSLSPFLSLSSLVCHKTISSSRIPFSRMMATLSTSHILSAFAATSPRPWFLRRAPMQLSHASIRPQETCAQSNWASTTTKKEPKLVPASADELP
jgi:serine/threonine protein kinase